jgi:hypothetical protein
MAMAYSFLISLVILSEAKNLCNTGGANAWTRPHEDDDSFRTNKTGNGQSRFPF